MHLQDKYGRNLYQVTKVFTSGLLKGITIVETTSVKYAKKAYKSFCGSEFTVTNVSPLERN